MVEVRNNNEIVPETLSKATMKDNSMINDYVLLAERRASKLKNLSLITEKAEEVKSEEDYVALYQEICVAREIFRWAQIDTPYYRNRLLAQKVLKVRDLAQMKVCLGLRLCRNWKGSVKVPLIPWGVLNGVIGQLDAMLNFAREWALPVERYTYVELVNSLDWITAQESALVRDLGSLQRGLALLNDEASYAVCAAEAFDIRQRIRAYKSSKNFILAELENV